MTSYGINKSIMIDVVDDVIQLACDVIRLGREYRGFDSR